MLHQYVENPLIKNKLYVHVVQRAFVIYKPFTYTDCGVFINYRLGVSEFLLKVKKKSKTFDSHTGTLTKTYLPQMSYLISPFVC